MKNIRLSPIMATFEDSIITLSGPALAISGIIAGVDLLTGGTMLKQVWWLSFVWAICLLLTLDFQVLSLGARSHRTYLSDKSNLRKFGEIATAVVIAAGVSSVSIQMQSIIARANGVGIGIEQATYQLGINPIALIWERSALVLVLIFLSGWFRDENGKQTPTVAVAPNIEAIVNTAVASAMSELNTAYQQRIEQLDATYQQRLQVVFEQFTRVQVNIEQQTQNTKQLPERTVNSEQAQVFTEQEGGDKKEQVRLFLLANPKASVSDIVNSTKVSRSYASTVRSQVFAEQQESESPDAR